MMAVPTDSNNKLERCLMKPSLVQYPFRPVLGNVPLLSVGATVWKFTGPGGFAWYGGGL